MIKKLISLCFIYLFCTFCIQAQDVITTTEGPSTFPLVTEDTALTIVASDRDHFLVGKAAEYLQADIQKVTGKKADIQHDFSGGATNYVIVGSADRSPLIKKLAKDGKIDLSQLKGKWESYKIQIVENPTENIDRALVIVGSDRRGTAYGVFTLSRQMGVSPWYWWADVPVEQKEELYARGNSKVYGPPQVKYRGIFINDEAPALSGWAYEKYGEFNSDFYERVFELILRHKANYLWPAMWGRMFNVDDPENPELAEKYGIVMGTSHHEPLMRAHAEWDEFGEGDWNYQTNDSTLRDFWRKGMERMGDREGIVTVGMRGDGDKPMSDDRNIELLENIVDDQRKIIEEVTGEDASETPQIWALYKEVQEYYDQGMDVPEDITLLFSDDNWGNIRHLPELKDNNREGGYGIYYHFDYVGGPRSYKWINTNPLPKIWQQMNMAYEYNAKRIWIVNVGDIKPMEFPTSFFLDYAWNPEQISVDDLPDYTKHWAADQFGTQYAADVAEILTKYGKYNSRRKPELLSADTYSLIHYREAGRVVEDYNQLTQKAEQIYSQLPEKQKAAFYQLVMYPVKASANLNEMYVALAKNRWYAEQGRSATNKWAGKVEKLFHKDAELADYYNTEMADGKWNHMMDQPNIGYTSWDDPEEDIMPEVDSIKVPEPAEMGVAVQGSEKWWPNAKEKAELPAFNTFEQQKYYIEIFNRGETPFEFEIGSDKPWLQFSESDGEIDQQKRIWITVDWENAPAGNYSAPISVSGADSKVKIHATINNPKDSKRREIKGFVESNGYISMEAAHFSKAVGTDDIEWQTIPDLGRTLSGVAPMPVTAERQETGGSSPHLEYNIHLKQAGEVTVKAYMSPTLDVHASGGLQFTVSIDDQEPKIVTMDINEDYESWAETVSNNIHLAKTNLSVDEAGNHTLKFWMLDPGVVLQKLVVDTGGLQPTYLGPPESYFNNVSSTSKGNMK